MAAPDDASTQLEQRRVDLPTTGEIKGYLSDFREPLREGTFPERRAAPAASKSTAQENLTLLC